MSWHVPTKMNSLDALLREDVAEFMRPHAGDTEPQTLARNLTFYRLSRSLRYVEFDLLCGIPNGTTRRITERWLTKGYTGYIPQLCAGLNCQPEALLQPRSVPTPDAPGAPALLPTLQEIVHDHFYASRGQPGATSLNWRLLRRSSSTRSNSLFDFMIHKADDTFEMTIGRNVWRLRALREMSQEALFAAAGLSRSETGCWAIEHGRVQLSCEELQAIAGALRTTVEELQTPQTHTRSELRNIFTAHSTPEDAHVDTPAQTAPLQVPEAAQDQESTDTLPDLPDEPSLETLREEFAVTREQAQSVIVLLQHYKRIQHVMQLRADTLRTALDYSIAREREITRELQRLHDEFERCMRTEPAQERAVERPRLHSRGGTRIRS